MRIQIHCTAKEKSLIFEALGEFDPTISANAHKYAKCSVKHGNEDNFVHSEYALNEDDSASVVVSITEGVTKKILSVAVAVIPAAKGVMLTIKNLCTDIKDMFGNKPDQVIKILKPEYGDSKINRE